MRRTPRRRRTVVGRGALQDLATADAACCAGRGPGAPRRTAGRAAGILILVGVVNLPIIHFSVQWWNTLHQGSSGILQQAIDPSMRTPLRWSILGYLLVFGALTLMRLRNLILFTERHRPWAIDVAQRGSKS